MSFKDPDMLAAAGTDGYSASVEIELFVNGQRFSVGQCGGGMLIFDEPTLLPGTEGELVLTIDGHPYHWWIAIQRGTEPARIIHAEFKRAN